jgi:TM2 domain-containing membrane protein YozV
MGMNMGMGMGLLFGLFQFFSVAIYLGTIIFAIYAVISILKLMKQKNEYLKDIRDELRNKQNNIE